VQASLQLDALVRKSLLVADRSAGRIRFSMLETIRQFAEDLWSYNTINLLRCPDSCPRREGARLGLLQRSVASDRLGEPVASVGTATSV
jgi:hypothetical protein